jgi:hypothetical protein
MNRIAILGVLLGTVCTLTGCFNRQLVRFETHPSKQVVLMETLDTHDYWLWSDHQHVFWSCAEQSDTLDCKRRCGGGSDLACPAAQIFTNTVGTNVR